MAEKKAAPKSTEKPKGDDDPLAEFPTDVKGGRWEFDEATGDKRWVADDADA